MSISLESDVSTVIEEEMFQEQELLLRRLTPYTTMRLHDVQSLRQIDGNACTHKIEDILLDRFGSKTNDDEDERDVFIKAEKNTDVVVVNGSENNDVPVEYLVKGLKRNELPVIGVYVHPKISPGFSYRVRYNNSQQLLFSGEARCLESIGMGYGKRLTFTGDSRNNNDNYFWSDSQPEGFAFSLIAVQPYQKFIIYTSQMEPVGEVVVEAVSDDQLEEHSKTVDGAVYKYVHVSMDCSINYYQRHHGLLELHHTDVESINGLAVLLKPKREKRAYLKCIENVNFSCFGKCSLYQDL